MNQPRPQNFEQMIQQIEQFELGNIQVISMDADHYEFYNTSSVKMKGTQCTESTFMVEMKSARTALELEVVKVQFLIHFYYNCTPRGPIKEDPIDDSSELMI